MVRAMCVCTIALGLVLASATLAPLASADPTGPAVLFVTVARGSTSRILEPVQQVIRDRNAWLVLWSRHAGQAVAAPAVDFGGEMAIAVFGGATAPPAVLTITRIVREPDRLVVWYAVRGSPLPDSDVQQRVVPFHIVRLARSSLPVSFFKAKTFPAVPQP